MGLKTMSLLANASVGFTGGTALNFVDDGVSIPNGLHVVCTTDADFTTRRQVTFKYRPSTLDAKTGKWTKDKKSITLVRPCPQTDGSVIFETIRIEREVLPGSTAADKAEFNHIGAQLLNDSDLGGFWDNGSLS